MFRFPELNLAQCSRAETTPACTAPSTRARSMNVSAAVEDSYHVAIDDTTRPGIGRTHFQQAGFFHLLDHRHITKRGIQKVVRLAGQQLQRKLPRLRTVPRFLRRGESHDRIEPLRFEFFTIEFSLATRLSQNYPSANGKKSEN